MGIPGLCTFFSSNEESVFRPLKLQNSYLVIDGNNIKHKLYMRLCSFEFGGDYEVYYKGLKTIFLDLKKCNITPIVVWDGVSDNKEVHIKIREWANLIQKLKEIKCNQDVTIFPIFQSRVFIDVLNELEIIHVTALEDADKEAAIIAKILQCPLLSTDTDFYCFNIQFIPLEKMDFLIKEDPTLGPGHEYYFDCYNFDRAAFFKQYDLTQDLFLLLPALLHEIHLQNNIFENFLERHCFTCQRSCERIKRILMWFRELNSYDDALTHILTDAEECDKNKMLDIIKKVSEYFKSLDKPISPYIKINKAELKIKIDEDIEQEMLPKQHFLSRYPKYVINSYIKHDIESVFIKVASEEAIIFSTVQWEDEAECATTQISMPILSGALQIMKRVLGEDITKTIMMRQGRRYQKVLMYNTKNFLIGVTGKIFTAEQDERKRVFFEVVNFDESEKSVVNEIGRDWSIFIVSILYWMKNRGRYLRYNKFEARKLNSIVMTALVSHAQCLRNGDPFESSFLSDIPDGELSHFGERVRELRKGEADIKYSLPIIHDFALLQASIHSIMSLNRILNAPFPEIRIHKFFTGQIAHDLCQLMREPNYADNALMDTRTIRDLYYRLIDNIRKAVPVITD